MIHPLLNVNLRATIWYQGESNAGYAEQYKCRFPALINDWREKFELPEMHFYFVQLAAYQDADWMDIRAAQTEALKLQHVGMATAIDLGDPESALNPSNFVFKADYQ
jgi:sialate O-acetylesterase